MNFIIAAVVVVGVLNIAYYLFNDNSIAPCNLFIGCVYIGAAIIAIACRRK